MKTKVPALLDIYVSKWFGLWWGAAVWREAFGNASKLPSDSGHRIIVDDTKEHSVVLYLEPPAPKGVCRHRVFVLCPRCSRKIPAGRIHQHTC